MAPRRWAPGLAAVAVGATSVTTAVVTGTTGTFAALPVELAAVITPANSTAQIFAGSTYYGVDYSQPNPYGQVQVVPFFLGPQGIADAISAAEGERTVVLASGWGAGQTGTALALLQQNDPDALANVEMVILDNNSNRAGGGFWTTYAAFAPLLATSAAPSPSDIPGLKVIDVAYEYNVNSNAPTYPGNVFASANTLVAYVYGYGGQATTELPDNLESGKHYVIDSEGNILETYDLPAGTTTTYVTVKSDGLPLVRPLRAIPGGDAVADAIEPTLTVLVNAGYKDNTPIPEDPTQTRPAGLLPSAEENATAVRQLQIAATQGVSSVQTNLSVPDSASTDSLSGRATKPDPEEPLLRNRIKPLRETIDMTGGNLVKPRSVTGGTPSTGGPRPVQQVVNGVTSAVNGIAKSLKDAAQGAADAVKDADSSDSDPD